MWLVASPSAPRARQWRSIISNYEETIRDYWNVDARTYDDAVGHHPRNAAEIAAWSAALRRLLPAPPARVLDVGAGTGFLSLLLARQGFEVTALDLAPEMLARLTAKATALGLSVVTVEGRADEPPLGDFDAVVERHLLWTLEHPDAALSAWRRAAPGGRLVAFESIWGEACGPLEELRATARAWLRRLRGGVSDHHAEYAPELRQQLPFGRGTSPEELVRGVEATAWGPARVERLRDVEWAAVQAMPGLIDRLIGVAPRFAVIAGS